MPSAKIRCICVYFCIVTVEKNQQFSHIKSRFFQLLGKLANSQIVCLSLSNWKKKQTPKYNGNAREECKYMY